MPVQRLLVVGLPNRPRPHVDTLIVPQTVGYKVYSDTTNLFQVDTVFLSIEDILAFCRSSPETFIVQYDFPEPLHVVEETYDRCSKFFRKEPDLLPDIRS